jgi:hypothetical protein
MMRASAGDALRAYGGQVPAREAVSRNAGRWRDIEQRAQDEGALLHARVRDRELRDVDAAACE